MGAIGLAQTGHGIGHRIAAKSGFVLSAQISENTSTNQLLPRAGQCQHCVVPSAAHGPEVRLHKSRRIVDGLNPSSAAGADILSRLLMERLLQEPLHNCRGSLA
jgi:hypothetical protein